MMNVFGYKVWVPVAAFIFTAALFFSIYHPSNGSSGSATSKTFVFLDVNKYNFGTTGHRKTILNSTEFVRVEIAFDWCNANLTANIKVNDDDFSAADYLGLVFDIDDNYIFEKFFYLEASNRTITQSYGPVLMDWGGIVWGAEMAPITSSWHYCTFNSSSGYYFHFSISKTTLNFHQPMGVHLCYGDMNAASASNSTEEARRETVAYWEFEL